MKNPVSYRTFRQMQNLCVGVLVAVYGFLSLFGMGLHVFMPECCEHCDCHAECYVYDSHNTQANPPETQLESHSEQSHSAVFCPICHFFLTHTSFSTWTVSVPFIKVNTRIFSAVSRKLTSEIPVSFPVRAPPVE